CPHRAFLASLILVSKFMQSEWYPNCTWAKLVGLPTQKISRCKNAPDETLGWTLWV
ncbi:hypothetical protein EDB89DRAFT_1835769, partial [Lactarius sanguifluus]